MALNVNNDGPKAKKRKLTDKSIPNGIAQHPEFSQDSRMYQDLLDMERKLDWTMSRKRAEIQDTLVKPPTATRVLRLFLSHTVTGQTWQNPEPSLDGLDINPDSIPAWSFKIEGRLLETPRRTKDTSGTNQKFSTCIKRMVIELDRDKTLYPDENIIEWPRGAGTHNPQLDGFSVRRLGDAPTQIRVVIHLAHYPEQFKIREELASILGIREESRNGIAQALWNYIKVNELQDKVDRRMIRLDDTLRTMVVGAPEAITFQQLPEFVNACLVQPEPIVLEYLVDPSIPPPEKPQAWDVEVKAEDLATKSRMTSAVQMSKESLTELIKLEDEIAVHAQALANSYTKRTFLSSFAQDPAKFIDKWLESQSRDLESVLGSGPSEGATVRAEDLRRSDFFRLPWVEEAVAVQEGKRVAETLRQALQAQQQQQMQMQAQAQGHHRPM